MNIGLIDNIQRIIPAALYVATEATEGTVIVRLDVHLVPKPDCVDRCLAVLEETGSANAGGVCGKSNQVRMLGMHARSRLRHLIRSALELASGMDVV